MTLPGERVGLGACTRLDDVIERGQQPIDGLDRVVWATERSLLLEVPVDVAELALFLLAKVLTHAKDGQVEEVAPLDGRSDLGDGRAIGEHFTVVGRRR